MLEKPDYFNSGEQITLRDIDRGKTRAVVPMVVVADGPEYTATYLAPGTQLLFPATGFDSHSEDAVKSIASMAWGLRHDS